jgi:hypothetical protein
MNFNSELSLDVFHHILKFVTNSDLMLCLFVDRNFYHMSKNEARNRLAPNDCINRFGLVGRVYSDFNEKFSHNDVWKIFIALIKIVEYCQTNFMCSQTWIFGCLMHCLNYQHFEKIEEKFKRFSSFKKFDDFYANQHQIYSCLFLLMQKESAKKSLRDYYSISQENILVFKNETIRTLKQCLKHDVSKLWELVEKTRSIFYVKFIQNQKLYQTLLSQDDHFYSLNKRDRLIYCRHPENFDQVRKMLANSDITDEKVFDQLLKLPMNQMKLVLSCQNINIRLIKLCRLYHTTANIQHLISQL